MPGAWSSSMTAQLNVDEVLLRFCHGLSAGARNMAYWLSELSDEEQTKAAAEVTVVDEPLSPRDWSAFGCLAVDSTSGGLEKDQRHGAVDSALDLSDPALCAGQDTTNGTDVLAQSSAAFALWLAAEPWESFPEIACRQSTEGLRGKPRARAGSTRRFENRRSAAGRHD